MRMEGNQPDECAKKLKREIQSELLNKVERPADKRRGGRTDIKDTECGNLATCPHSRRSLAQAVKTDRAPED